MFLGIEIGGTKLQLGAGAGDGSSPAELIRLDVLADRGAAGILEQLDAPARRLVTAHGISRVGIGFGGPVDAAAGRVRKSHQIAGWEDLPLVDWCRDRWGVAAVLGNDCDVAALAEARFGAGQGRRTVFFVTVGTGIGGGFVVDGRSYGGSRPAVAEIGHLRPGPQAESAGATVESLASGRGIEAAARRRIRRAVADEQAAADELLAACDGEPARLTAVAIAAAAAGGNPLARQSLDEACRVLGWAIAQAITLLAPEIVVVGGGVSLIGEERFFEPLRRAVDRYVFPPLKSSCDIAAAQLGEQVVVHGALALAAMSTEY